MGNTAELTRVALLSHLASIRLIVALVKITRKSIASTIVFVTTTFVSLLLFGAAPRPQKTETLAQLVPGPTEPIPQREEPQLLIDIFSDEDISYNGYQMRHLTETITDETVRNLEVSYAGLMKNNRRLLKFDGVYFVAGNSTEFGLFSLLGNSSQQFIVSQTVPRTGRHWVVSVTPEVRVLFDSSDYGVFREEFYVIDLDKDGIYEISLPATAFYTMQDKMYIGEIPLPEIIFKYDPKTRKYLPANYLFPDYALRDIQSDIERLSGEDSNYLSTRLDILLRYVYARKEQEGWAFFEREYKRPDKKEIKARIISVLKHARVYK